MNPEEIVRRQRNTKRLEHLLAETDKAVMATMAQTLVGETEQTQEKNSHLFISHVLGLARKDYCLRLPLSVFSCTM